MKKELILLFSLFAFIGIAQAQVNGGFGLRGGLALSKYSVGAQGISVSFGNTIQYYGRAFYLTPVGYRSGLQFEAGVSGRGFKIDFSSQVPGGPGNEINSNYQYLDLGALYRYSITLGGPTEPYLVAGPVFGYALGGTSNNGNTSESVDFSDEGVNRLDLSLELGGGLAFGPLGQFAVELRYTAGLLNLVDNEGADPDDEGTVKHSAFQLGLAVKF